MNSHVDRCKTLTELEHEDWGEPTYGSFLETRNTIHWLRHKPIQEFSVEDLRITIEQDIGLAYLVPIAIERLEENPFAEGDCYAGDLLNAVLTMEDSFWSGHPELLDATSRIAQQADRRRDELCDFEKERLDEGLGTFRLRKSRIV